MTDTTVPSGEWTPLWPPFGTYIPPAPPGGPAPESAPEERTVVVNGQPVDAVEVCDDATKIGRGWRTQAITGHVVPPGTPDPPDGWTGTVYPDPAG